ncbi:MAG: glycosyl transferase family 1 [Piscirickettsiaceae bacterium]|nr:MAG: glycosyl transferase family 1 [Piscirickettsiaceae bacterium]PCI70640.1 MAG: glycosyl transferase family 1 [Piscirickettsiaceae bacterium]
MNVLSFTTLYPNAEQPRHGIFIEQRLRHLAELEDVALKVVAPVPWFPAQFGQYGLYARVPRIEQRNGIEVFHPRYLVILKVGMSITPLFLALSGYKQIKRMIADGYKPDVIDAHYFYPDGVAAALIGQWLNIPITITARGSDINLLPKFALPKKMILWAAKKSMMNITVSQALKKEMQKLGVPEEKITVLRNGVDLETFKILPDVRKQRGGDTKQLISVGNLIELKGHHLVIEALQELPNVELNIIGEGPKEADLKQLASHLGVDDRVHFLGYKTHRQLAELYNQADALILASSREGMPNVLLEAMACGTPVIATNVGGAEEVITDKVAGILLNERSIDEIVKAIKTLLLNRLAAKKTRKHAEQFSWDATIMELFELLKTNVK